MKIRVDNASWINFKEKEFTTAVKAATLVRWKGNEQNEQKER